MSAQEEWRRVPWKARRKIVADLRAAAAANRAKAASPKLTSWRAFCATTRLVVWQEAAAAALEALS